MPLSNQTIYCVIVTGPENSFYHDRYTCTMIHSDFLKLKTHIDKYFDGFEFYAIPVAHNITPKQLLKFYNVEGSALAIREVLKWFEHDADEIWLEAHRQNYKMVQNQLDINKWNPRSVLGKLEFDRRAVEDGITWRE